MSRGVVICYDVYGIVGRGSSEHLGLFTNFSKAEKEAKKACKNYPSGVEIDYNVYDKDSVKAGDADKVYRIQTKCYLNGKFIETLKG